jgi:Na+:H+ antiporter, NhaA family
MFLNRERSVMTNLPTADQSNDLKTALWLLAAVVVAILLANSSVAQNVSRILDQGAFGLSLHQLINDGLMALFFLIVGLELKRELLEGTLADPRRAAQPLIAAAAGMAMPAVIYLALNSGDATNMRGWAIPAATDIAFAVGALALLGSRIRSELRIFLLALAVADDLGAILVIAFYYSTGIDAQMLGGVMLCLLALIAMNRAGVMGLALYLIVGGLMWFFMWKSGVHPTLAGVLLALTIPHRNTGPSRLNRLEHGLKPFVNYCVLPLFALANAGVVFQSLNLNALSHSVSLGTMLGLALGKPLGIALAVIVASKLMQVKPVGTAREMLGIACLAGIGFTMSLFIGGLAFRWHEELFAHARAGIYIGSLLSAMLGLGLLYRRN